jgi:TM2 domain-containing membrane protein YozV
MDALEAHLLMEQAKVKSPGFAAILGFFFPALAAFYVGKILVGIACLIIDFFNLILAIVGIGILGLIRFRGHFPKGGYDVHTDGRNDSQEPAPPPAVR